MIFMTASTRLIPQFNRKHIEIILSLDFLAGRPIPTHRTNATTISLPPRMGPLPFYLYGPYVGDEPIEESEVSYEDKWGGNRRIIDRPPRKIKELSVVTAPVHGFPTSTALIVAAYGGTFVFPDKGSLLYETSSEATREQIDNFWKFHALTQGAPEYVF